ncbi:MAG: glycyl-radical enzyme activating protein [Pseudomonadota bacterium]
MEALVLEIQRMSTDDGPGIRTTIFFKGCPLSCAWCHNPESIPRGPQVQWIGSRCISCRLCLDACPRGALSARTGGIAVDRDRCEGCGACAEECPSTALERMGTTREVEALADEVARDRAFYDRSGGGVTLSGGEPTLQPAAAEALLRTLRARGIHTALDTCGLCSWETLERLLPHTDLLLFDLKEADPARHRSLAGADNGVILENLRRSCARASDSTDGLLPEIWVRTPVIPGATAREETIRGIGALLATLPRGALARWDLCRFNNLCRDKYTRLGLEWSFADTPLLTEDELEAVTATARASGVDPAIVHC